MTYSSSPVLTVIVALPFYNIVLRAQKPDTRGYPLELKTLGDHLKKKRLDLGLFQKDVAKQLGVSLFSVLSWEKNRAEPELRFIPRIITFLGYLPFTDILNKPLDEKILLVQQLYGLSQEALARQLGVDPCTLARWGRGKGWPNIEGINRLLTIEKWSSPFAPNK